MTLPVDPHAVCGGRLLMPGLVVAGAGSLIFVCR
jgi:hypothetical protein